MSTALRVAFISVLPSPYQRDIFAALAKHEGLQIKIFYMEKSAPDSPWPQKPLQDYETYLPGFWIRLGHARIHANWNLPSPRDYDFIICNTLMSLTAQWLMRAKLRTSRWIFWGEKLGSPSRKHDTLTSPLRRARAIAAIGRWAAQDYATRFPGIPIFNIPYHCALSPFLTVKSRPRHNGITTFLFCGQMIARKGLDLLLAAFAQMPTHTRLLLIGREADLPAHLAKLPESVRRRVEYVGFHPPDALPEYFANADVFVLPSRYDGWGVVVNQALGAGLPIIVSDQVGAGYDLVEEGKNGFVFSSNDSTHLAQKMSAFIRNPSLITSMGEASRTMAASWTPQHGAARWIEALEAIAQ